MLVDSDWNSAEHKIDYLRTNPATAAMSAVQHERFIVLPFASTEAGVRSASAAASIAEQWRALG